MMFKDTGGISSGTCKLLPLGFQTGLPSVFVTEVSVEHSGTHLCVLCTAAFAAKAELGKA